MSSPTPAPSALWQRSATELAAAIRERRVSAVEVAESHLSRIRETNPVINALADFDESAVLAAARAADAEVASGRPLGPLHGVPVSIKVNTDEAGEATTNGLPANADDVAPRDAAVTALLRRAGAVFVGRNNVPQYSFRWFSENPVHGRSLNPWSAALTPGGSSGGAAGAVAAGMVPIAHGNDIGGSVRYPAYACGVVGIRPTIGLVPAEFGWRGIERAPSIADTLMCTHGPLARTVADLRLGLRAMTGFDPRDGVTAPISETPGQPLRRVGIVRDPGVLAPTPELDAALDQAAGHLSDRGIEVVEIEVPELAQAHHLWSLLLLEEMREMRELMDDFGDDIARKAMDGMIEFAVDRWGAEVGGRALHDGWTDRNTALARITRTLEETPVILTPPSARPPFPYGTDVAGDTSTDEMHRAQWPQKSLPVLGLPGVTVPTGIADSVPTGVQIFGARFSDQTLLDVAQIIEDASGTFTPIDPRG